MLAVVMAGGKGTRLRPLTCDKPKPMVPVANRPLLEHVLRHLRRSGWERVALTLCFQSDKIESYFGDGSRCGVDLHYLVEDRPLGTAGSVKLASGLVDGTFLVGSGDALCDLDLGAALDFHRERNALVTLILARVASPLEYGVVMTDPDGRIVRFLEKPGWGEVFSDTVNTGFYLIEPRVLDLIPAGRPFDFSRDLFPELLRRGERIYGYPAEGYWSDIGTLEQYRRTHLDVLRGRVRLDLPGGEVRPGVHAGQGTEIDPEAQVEGPALLGEYCRVERGARIGAETVIGDYALVAAGASLKRCILWRHVYVGPGTELRGAILGDHVLLRNDCAVHEGAVLGDGAHVGAYARFAPGVKLWPGKNVESGSMVRESLVWSAQAVRGLFGATGVSGVAGLELTPESAARLGGAFASVLGADGRAALVATDGSPAACVLGRAAQAGLLGAGRHVREADDLTVPAARFAVGALGLAGGLHVCLSGGDPGRAVIQFFDARGLPVSRQVERGIEQAFFTEDFARADASRVGRSVPATGIAEAYLDGLRDGMDNAAVRAAGFTVVLGPIPEPAAALAAGLLARIGCRVAGPVMLAGGAGADRQIPMTDRIAEVQAVLGAMTDGGGEELVLFDERGREIGQAQLTTLLSYAALRRGEGRRLPVAVTETEAVGDLARIFRRALVRLKAQRRALLEEFAAESPEGRGLLLPAFDALASLARILELLAREGRPLSAILAELPVYARVERTLPCSWEGKGRLMRRLAEEYRDRRAEFTDGLRVLEPGGWALVLPDGEEPLVRVYSEARTAEEADALNRRYVELIRSLQRAEGLPL